MPGDIRALAVLTKRGTVAKTSGSRPQRALAALQSLTANGIVKGDAKSAWKTQQALTGLYRDAHVRSPLRLLASLLAVYVAARQCSTKTGVSEVASLSGGTMTLETYNMILNVVNPVTGASLGMVVASLHLHPVFKDQGAALFFSNGAAWWRMQAELRPDRATSKAIVLTALFLSGCALGSGSEILYGIRAAVVEVFFKLVCGL